MESLEITFTQLSNGYVRCNQTGEKLKAKRADTYRRMKMNESLKKGQNKNNKPEEKIKTAKVFSGIFVRCPYCEVRQITGRTTKMRCANCGEVFLYTY